MSLFAFMLGYYTRSTDVGLAHYFEKLSKKTNSTMKSASKQAYSKARLKFRHTAFKELNEDAVSEYYKLNDYKHWHGHRLLAVDGTRLQLPGSPEIRAYFGEVGASTAGTMPMATESIAYDVLNEMIVDVRIGKGYSSERSLALEHSKAVEGFSSKKSDIFLFDRGYPQYYMFSVLVSRSQEFVCRVSESDGKEIKKFIESQSTDSMICIPKKSKSIQQAKREGFRLPNYLDLRIVRVRSDNGQEAYLLTSLVDQEQYPTASIAELYNYRWSVETHYHFQKHRQQIENFTGKSVESIYQDIYARVLSYTICQLLIKDASEELTEEMRTQGKTPDVYKINKSVAYGIYHDRVIDLLFFTKPPEYPAKLDRLLTDIKRHKQKVSKNKTKNRKQKNKYLYPINTKSII